MLSNEGPSSSRTVTAVLFYLVARLRIVRCSRKILHVELRANALEDFGSELRADFRKDAVEDSTCLYPVLSKRGQFGSIAKRNRPR